VHNKTPRRRCFNDHRGLNSSETTFSVPILSAVRVFQKETGLKLFYNSRFDNYWRGKLTTEELKLIKDWIRNRGRFIFLRDCLFCSIALAVNMDIEVAGRKKYTRIGLWEHRAKEERDEQAIANLAAETIHAIQELPFYKDADYICAVPPAPHKAYDLPSCVAAEVSKQIGKTDITPYFKFGGEKKSVKSEPLATKWDIWDNAELSFTGNLTGKTVILIDDKYQAGITLQYVSMKLQEAGASEVYGLCFVKTWGDEDNQGR